MIYSKVIQHFNKMELFKYEKRIYSQNGEDGILEKLINDLAITNKESLEIGSGNTLECNTRNLSDWIRTYFDKDFEDKFNRLYKHKVTEDNINNLINYYNLNNISLLSIDIDGQDFYLWKNLSNASPIILVIEYNCRIPSKYSYVMKRDINYEWDMENINYSSSVGAIYKLGIEKGYSLVGSNSNGVNLYFVRNDYSKFLSKNLRNQINRTDLVYQIDNFDKKYFDIY